MNSNASPPLLPAPTEPPARIRRDGAQGSELISGRHRLAIAAGIALAHGLAFWWLMAGRTEPPGVVEQITTLVFIAPQPELLPEPEPTPEPKPTPLPMPEEPAPRTPQADTAKPPADKPPASPTPAPTAPTAATPPSPDSDAGDSFDIFDADGSVSLPDDVAARLKAVDEGSLAFGFEQPGLLEDGDFMRRPPPLEYHATQFDKYWRPEHDLLTALLEKAVAATSNEVEIPLVGGGKLLCKLSMLAMGGSCQMGGSRTTVSLDDPTTLSPAEDAQCAAWWDRIASPGSQAEWKQTRAVYDYYCLKPREKNLDPPEPKPRPATVAGPG